MSRNIFSIYDDTITITRPEGDFIAHATIRDDYKDEIQSVTWGLNNGRYLYNGKLGYLHAYIMEKWYGKEMCDEMKKLDYVIDHMDNDSVNCCINNLCFLSNAYNKAKGLTFDQDNKTKEFIAMTMFKDFDTQLFQITIRFNYPATLKGFEPHSVIEIAYLLYDCDYRQVINDAQAILLEYKQCYSFDPSKLRMIDYHIEGCVGRAVPPEVYEEYLSGEHGHGVFYFMRIAPIKNWTREIPEEYFKITDAKKGESSFFKLQ